MDADAEAGLELSDFDRFLRRRHINHQRRTGQDACLVSLRYSLIYSFAEPEIVRIYYDSLGHRQ
jgi:hypothetical protein